MKLNSIIRVIGFLLLFVLVLPGYAEASPPEFGREFGLFVHQKNQGLSIPLAKADQVLESFFNGSLLKGSAPDLNQFMSQREFLLSFEKKRMAAEKEVNHLSDTVLYPLVWLKARRNNWLPETQLTYHSMQEFLYRYSVSREHGGIPYFEGLVLNENEITPENYPSISTVRDIGESVGQKLVQLRKLERPTRTQQALLKSLVVYGEAFGQLELELRELHHPLNILPDLPEDIRQKIIENDLNQVLESVSYNYSKNNANRIHNMITGAMQINGRVYQPDEEIDFTEELGRDGWGIYKYGWVIFGGTEAWQFGGGLCGSATLTFTPSWRAGLEIITRFPHSVYYRSLYPAESLGLDATIYRGHKNLVMKNTTGSPILYYLRNDEAAKEVTMYVIGNSPYRHIEIEGPILTGRNTYKWIRRMEGFDGKVIEDELVTRYGLIH